MRLGKVWGMLVMFLLIMGAVSAQSECFLLNFDFSDWKKYASSSLQKNQILKEAELKKAYDLMNTYYADKGLCEVNQDYTPDKSYPNSPFLLDYLLNIGFRKLDAIESQLYFDLEPDPVGLEWRSKLEDMLKKRDPSVTPGEIKNLYDMYWNVEKRGLLFERYQLVCTEAFAIWQALVAPQRPDSFETETQLITNAFVPRCKQLVLRRAQQEQAFIEAQMQQQWEYVINEQVERYLVEYFDQQRLEELLKKVHKIVGIWWYIVRVVKWTLSCNW